MHLERARNLLLGQKVPHGVAQAAAHRIADLGHGGRRSAKLRQGVLVGAMDGRERVHQGAIEIEKDGAKSQGLIWIDSFSVEGPFYPEERSFFDALLCPVEPSPETPTKIVWNDANARELI